MLLVYLSWEKQTHSEYFSCLYPILSANDNLLIPDKFFQYKNYKLPKNNVKALAVLLK